jgi:hypothetical protein
VNSGAFVYYSDWRDTSAKRLNIDNPAAAGQWNGFWTCWRCTPTARYVCRKLCRRLIGDDPPDSIVDRPPWCSTTSERRTESSSRRSHIILSAEFKDRPVGRQGQTAVRIAGALRGAAARPTGAARSVRRWAAACQWAELQVQPDLYWRMAETGQCRSLGHAGRLPGTKPARLGSTPLVMTRRVLNSVLDYAPDDWAIPAAPA